MTGAKIIEACNLHQTKILTPDERHICPNMKCHVMWINSLRWNNF
jgi:hypothetical protein